LVWKVEFSKDANKALDRIGTADRRRLIAVLQQISQLDDPRVRGRALTGELAGYWRFRVGDIRLIATIEHDRLVIVVVTIGHRRAVYR
jgi:mRNA interferase RelE/StbE